MLTKITLFLVLALSLSGFASAGIVGIKDSVGTTDINGKVHIKYMVSPGETIYAISTKHGVSISELLEINPELENGLKVGQTISIPYKEAYCQSQKKKDQLSEEDGKIVHTVGPGETLYSLAKKYNVSVGDLLKWNGMELKSGQKLVVGYGNAKPATTPAAQQQTATPKPVPTTPTNTPKPTPDPKPATTTTEKPAAPKPQVIETASFKPTVYNYDSTMKQVLVIPFDPHLYFSDADDEISKASHIPRVKVRDVFRKRLNAMIDPRGYEVIHLLGGNTADSLVDLNMIYGSVTYNYQEILYSEHYLQKMENETSKEDSKNEGTGTGHSVMNWIDKQKDKITHHGQESTTPNKHEQFSGKYFGVKIRDPRFFNYFRDKYSIDYFVFVNQFEVITDYEHCLDRATQNYQRHFVAHFSIFDSEGKQIAGNKFKVFYPSNSNNVDVICSDNLVKIAQRVMDELPPAR